MEKAETQLTTQPVGRMHNCVIILLLWICIVTDCMVVHCNICAEFVRVFGLFGTCTCYLDDGKLFIVCKKRLEILNFIHIASTFALQAESSTGDSLDKYLCVFVWRDLHFAKSFSFLSSSLISFSQIHSIEDKSNAMQERHDCNGCYCINVKTLSFPFFCYLGDKAEDQQRQPIDNTMAI